MKLLIVTRKVDINDERMGFFVDWINEFARHAEKISVISVQQGSDEGLADNVDVYFASWKIFERKKTIIDKLFLYANFKRLAYKLTYANDNVFVHMIPLYANIVGKAAHRFNKPMMLWYMHKSVEKQLEKTQKWVTAYITASRESFRMNTNKPVHVVGHGIPVDKFEAHAHAEVSGEKNTQPLKLLTVGRLSESKGIRTLVEAIRIMVREKRMNVTCDIIGAPALKDDHEYLFQVGIRVRQYQLDNFIKFKGPQSHAAVIKKLPEYDMFINLSTTGSLDKAVLEAMAARLLIVTSNEAFKPMVGDIENSLMVPPHDAAAVVAKIESLLALPKETRGHLRSELRRIVNDSHNLPHTISSIIQLYEKQ